MTWLRLALVALAPLPTATAQLFVDGTANLPAGALNNKDTEQVDFADVDLDGDWDAALANGGDTGNSQNQLWINQGGAQGGVLGVFADATAAQLPVLSDASRDIEFADIDGDGDEDLAIANHSALTNQSNRLWVNLGLAQSGTLGFFADETAARYVGIGGPGSSVAPALLLPGGGFVDWSSDVDFADLDRDGDLDLVHSSYGSFFGGNVPTRLFLNDGEGFFEEWNPSGFQLPATNIANGNPALWAEGLQQANTTDTTGAFADIATVAIDVEASDLDGDLDIDLILGHRDGTARFFANRIAETGVLVFRDYTALALPPGAVSGGFSYEQELGDLDGDLDLDLYGLNWKTLIDAVYTNQGNGTFDVGQGLTGSNADEEEADFLDFDHDGDLDVYVANFSGADIVYENTGAGPAFGLVKLTNAESGLAFTTLTARDADVADVDGDGDDDVLVATGSGPKQNKLALNTTGAPDVTAPSIGATSAVASGAASPAPQWVRAQVYDNAPDYLTRYADVALAVEVDGVPLPAFPMRWAGGQVFHGELPGNLVGTLATRVRAV
ncbi:MAG TPA: VCBS repeat-containing protein, partial [Planctomycetota bacterium]|nr:VCBS repeat-containing protein [Planctomycetota bacterium]